MRVIKTERPSINLLPYYDISHNQYDNVNYTFPKPLSGTFTLSGILTEDAVGSVDPAWVVLVYFADNTYKQINYDRTKRGIRQTVTFTASESNKITRALVRNSNWFTSGDMIEIQLEEGSSFTHYEPFGTITNFYGDIKIPGPNLVDIPETDLTASRNITLDATLLAKVKGQTITFSAYQKLISGSGNLYAYIYVDGTAVAIHNLAEGYTTVTYTIPTTASEVKLTLSRAGSSVTKWHAKEIQLELGSQRTPYVPYGGYRHYMIGGAN